MAKKSLPAKQSIKFKARLTPEQSPRTNNAPELFSMSGTYQVAPGTTDMDLQNDITCWLESIHGTIDLICDGLQDEESQISANPRMVARALYGALHLVEMVRGALLASSNPGLDVHPKRALHGASTITKQ